jgi:hypothetical protein
LRALYVFIQPRVQAVGKHTADEGVVQKFVRTIAKLLFVEITDEICARLGKNHTAAHF